jgi:O-antigen/teichoic acid export membrane protein
MTDFAGWNLLASIVVVVSNHGIGIVMNMFFGTIVNAAQGVAAQLSGQLQAVTTTMSKVISPVLTKKAGKGLQQNLIIASCTSSKILFFLSSLICIPSIVTMPTLMKLWLGDVPEYAPFFCQSLLIVALCEQITSGLYSTILAKGDIKEVMIVKSCIRALYLPLIYILFKIGFSPIWAYITQIIIQAIINAMIINIYYAHKKAGISSSYYMKQVFIPAVSVVLFVLLIATTLAPIWNGIYKFFIVSTLTAIILIPIIYIFGFNKYEKNLVKQILKKTNKHGSIS